MNNSAPAVNISIAATAQLFKALGDKTRLKMVGLLTHGELCVCDLMAVLELPQSTVSRHLAYLKNSGWVIGRRSGKWMYYRLNPDLFSSEPYRLITECIAGLTDMQDEHTLLRDYLDQKDKQKCL